MHEIIMIIYLYIVAFSSNFNDQYCEISLIIDSLITMHIFGEEHYQ